MAEGGGLVLYHLFPSRSCRVLWLIKVNNASKLASGVLQSALALLNAPPLPFGCHLLPVRPTVSNFLL